MSKLPEAVRAGTTLDEAEAEAAMVEVLAGSWTDAQLTELLLALRSRNVAVDELVGFARAMRAAGTRIQAPDALDTCGTGGAEKKAFNISTATAFVLAAAGIKVAKHGNRSFTRPSGSADVMEQLGIPLDATPEACQHALDTVGLAFLFAPTFHPAVRHAAAVRQALGGKTVFNLLGPLCNPAGAKRQVMGVYDPQLVLPMAQALHRLGCEGGFVLHGAGADEATPCGPIQFATIEAEPRMQTLDPTTLVSACGPEAIAPVENGGPLLRELLAGGGSQAQQDAICLNAAFGLLAMDAVQDLATGVKRAREILRSGAGNTKMEALIGALQA